MDDETKAPESPSELSRLTSAVETQTAEIAAARLEITGAKQAMGRLADATLGIHSVTQRSARAVNTLLGTTSRIEAHVISLGKDVAKGDAKLGADVGHIEATVDRLRDDLTPVRGFALPVPETKKGDLSIEQHVQAAKTWATVLVPVLKWVAIGAITVGGWLWNLLHHAK